MNFLKLIRYQNLLLLAFMQLIFRYGFLKLQNVPVLLSLADWQYVLLVLSTICIAAGGYIINNIFDQGTDSENKPDAVIVGKYISESKAYSYYVAFNRNCRSTECGEVHSIQRTYKKVCSSRELSFLHH